MDGNTHYFKINYSNTSEGTKRGPILATTSVYYSFNFIFSKHFIVEDKLMS